MRVMPGLVSGFGLGPKSRVLGPLWNCRFHSNNAETLQTAQPRIRRSAQSSVKAGRDFRRDWLRLHFRRIGGVARRPHPRLVPFDGHRVPDHKAMRDAKLERRNSLTWELSSTMPKAAARSDGFTPSAASNSIQVPQSKNSKKRLLKTMPAGSQWPHSMVKRRRLINFAIIA